MSDKNQYELNYSAQDPPSSQPQTLSAPEQMLLQSQTTGFWGSHWTLEILSCLTAVAALVGIIAVLYVFDGQLVPDWPYGITLNALISLLTTAMKAAMAFHITEALSQLKWSWFNRGNKLSDLALLDSASRGAIGAGLVLFRFMPRHLVTFGCFIFVVAAAIAPFVQQVITTDLRPVHAPELSTIQTCNTSLYTDYDEGAGPGMNILPLTSMGAVYTGIFQSQSPNSNAVTMDCPTGNCTFAPYQSLGVCSKCANITSHLEKNVSHSYMTTYNYKLPNNFTFETSINMMYLMNATTSAELIELDVQGLPLALNFTAISAAGYGVPPQVSATECALYFCVDTYNTTVNNGKFNEQLLSSGTSGNYSAMSILGNVGMTPDTCYVNGTKHDNPDDCTYNVNAFSIMALKNTVMPMFNGNGSLFVSNRPSWSHNTLESAYGLYGNYTDINNMFKSLSSALTTNARSKVCKSTVEGVTWTVQSFVRVRWLWMILPIAMVVLSIFFLIITVVHTRHQYIWKSSPLALLFSNLSVEGPHGVHSSPNLSGMEDASKKMNVWLEATPGGVVLKGIPK
ncbi:hypothetical protein ASPWEDRAFT_49798 [Aspergillus wentii DTO 134E9]|uniref:Uncharacterized protein n=1 Tax=Aspergillus wentii DTO 134E9 TaxID=1073089 RepID=A0A1L9RYH3_ASPWE|nr:uncharacterized protein ASPWEDRAFT_49798 [Aspergillus wentii DTO 134E9]KAI9931380.1 hypothetical protein MW887_009955 [Aspergillus wentii]OJJ39953.1 hypothetical protein ASPWEDRAFT_49798 [Aspergillus wentii DTO 134E9]